MRVENFQAGNEQRAIGLCASSPLGHGLKSHSLAAQAAKSLGSVLRRGSGSREQSLQEKSKGKEEHKSPEELQIELAEAELEVEKEVDKREKEEEREEEREGEKKGVT